MPKVLLIVLVIIAAGVGVFFLLPKSTGDPQAGVKPAPSARTDKIAPPANTTARPATTPTDFSRVQAMMETNLGTVKLEFFATDAPKAVENFIRLSEKGYYNGLAFHRIIKDFMIQGGDPTGTGAGGTSIFGDKFEDELNPNTDSYKAGYKKGVVAMANSGKNTNGSQFFIMLKDTPLPHDYTIFGRVVAGQDVVDKIGDSITDPETNRPIKPVIIQKITIVEKK